MHSVSIPYVPVCLVAGRVIPSQVSGRRVPAWTVISCVFLPALNPIATMLHQIVSVHTQEGVFAGHTAA